MEMAIIFFTMIGAYIKEQPSEFGEIQSILDSEPIERLAPLYEALMTNTDNDFRNQSHPLWTPENR